MDSPAPLVLYVDDEADNLVVFEALYGETFRVATATGGAEALDRMRREEVGVLVTDQRMSGMTGVDLAELARREWPDLGVILVTGYADLGAVVDAINRGQVLRYLRKPWDATELEFAIREAMQLFRLRRQVQELERAQHDTGRVYTVDVVASTITHELATPLTVLLGDLDLARHAAARLQERGPDPASLASLTDHLEHAREGAQVLVDTLQGLRAIPRPLPGDQVVDLAETARAAVRMAQGVSRDRARVELDTRPTPRVRGSAVTLGQALLHLLVAAIRRLPPERADKNVVRIAVRGVGGMAEVVVDDNGPTLGADGRARLFDPLAVDATGTSGLGLAVARRIFEDHGGRLSLDEAHPAGVRLRGTLPGETAPDAAARPG